MKNSRNSRDPGSNLSPISTPSKHAESLPRRTRRWRVLASDSSPRANSITSATPLSGSRTPITTAKPRCSRSWGSALTMFPAVSQARSPRSQDERMIHPNSPIFSSFSARGMSSSNFACHSRHATRTSTPPSSPDRNSRCRWDSDRRTERVSRGSCSSNKSRGHDGANFNPCWARSRNVAGRARPSPLRPARPPSSLVKPSIAPGSLSSRPARARWDNRRERPLRAR